ncbi:MAG: terminase large subunit domain-containing protein [Ewingella sp.]|uniref:terminase large subunit domain-containing protein n=1 Tax=Ewingella TaxID=41201 RepID=UPI003365598D
MAKYSNEIKEAARALYIKRWTPKDIAQELNLPPRTIYHWADVGQWAGLLPAESIEDSIARRVNQLTNREKKTALELEELRDLVAQHVKLMAQNNKHAEKMAEIKAKSMTVYDDGGFEGGGSGEGRKRKYKKNDISSITPEMLEEWSRTHLYEYQLHCRDHKDEDWRFVLKSRQVGMTYYFAWEAFEDAVLTGDNQVFFSASRAQSEIFREYIVQFAQLHFGITLTGKNIRLSNGAILRFLSTNASTAQGFNGHLYGDEVFWIPKFTKLHEVASAMATHDKFRTTYFSTPSAKTHQAYGVWTGEAWSEDDAKRKGKVFPKDKVLREGGVRCPDEIWRYIITMEDAVKRGLGAKVNIEKLRNKYNATTYAMLYMCEFVDSKDAVFKFSTLTACEVDGGTWGDYDPTAVRPFGNREVWAGFDPSRSGDNSTFVVVAPPIFDGERFRVLAIYQWQGLNFSWQAEQIKQLMRRFNITYIGIDTTGIGRGVYDLVTKFAPREAHAILYSVESKNRLVMKMIDVVERKRIEWVKDAQDETNKERAEIPASFMAIRRTTTASGNALTFVAERSEATGHADVFFAISHAVINEPLDYEFDRPSTWAFGKAA